MRRAEAAERLRITQGARIPVKRGAGAAEAASGGGSPGCQPTAPRYAAFAPASTPSRKSPCAAARVRPRPAAEGEHAPPSWTPPRAAAARHVLTPRGRSG
jgi:hypothetical protein